MINDDEIFDASFIPRDGLTWIDTCGVRWVCGEEKKMSREDRLKILRVTHKKLDGFYSFFRRMNMPVMPDFVEGGRNMASTRGVLDEIICSVKHWNMRRESIEKSGKNGRAKAQNYKTDLDAVRGVIGAYNRMISLIQEGVAFGESVQRPPMYSQIEEFVDVHDKRQGAVLSDVDKELVVNSLSSGSFAGILTADVALMKTFGAAATHFGKRNAYICDSMNCQTRRAYRFR